MGALALWYVLRFSIPADLIVELTLLVVCQADLLPGLGAKQPKAVAGCIMALKEIVRCIAVSINIIEQRSLLLEQCVWYTDDAAPTGPESTPESLRSLRQDCSCRGHGTNAHIVPVYGSSN